MSDTAVSGPKSYEPIGCNAFAKIEAKVAALSHEPGAAIYVCAPMSPYAVVTIKGNVDGLFGCSAVEFLKTPDYWLAHLHPDDKSRMPDFFQDPAISDHEWQYRWGANGNYQWINDNLSALRDERGDISWFVGICTTLHLTLV